MATEFVQNIVRDDGQSVRGHRHLGRRVPCGGEPQEPFGDRDRDPDPGRTSRRKISKEELELVKAGRAPELEGVYVGRATGPDGETTKWGNPFRIGVHGTRTGVIKLFRDLIVDRVTTEEVLELQGKVLLCHCGKGQPCHADIMCDLADAEQLKEVRPRAAGEVKDNFKGNRDEDPVMLDFIDDGLPVRSAGVPETAPAPPRDCRRAHTERRAYFMGKSRSFEDGGGGLCSPGRLRKEDRADATPLSRKILEQARSFLDESVKAQSAGKDTTLGFMMKLAAGRFDDCPFDKDVVEKMAGFMGEALGLREEDREVEGGQSFRLRMCGALLKELGDPDWPFFELLENGVPIGVGVTMPRTPQVFDQKTKWALDEDFEGAHAEVENYRSLHGYEADVKRLFEEEARLGWMKEMTDEQAQKEYGQNLHVAGLAVVVERDKFRVVHDGTHGVKVNPRIRVQDQAKSPTAGEIRTLMVERHGGTGGSRQFVLVGDVSKAHRRVKVRRQDWGWQACRLEEGRVWVNCVGTYGIASAGYWWARLSSAVLVRLFYYLLSPSGGQDALLFADDLLMVAGRLSEILDLGALILVWVALGVPWKWKNGGEGTRSHGLGIGFALRPTTWGSRSPGPSGFASGSVRRWPMGRCRSRTSGRCWGGSVSRWGSSTTSSRLSPPSSPGPRRCTTWGGSPCRGR